MARKPKAIEIPGDVAPEEKQQPDNEKAAAFVADLVGEQVEFCGERYRVLERNVTGWAKLDGLGWVNLGG